MTKPRIPFPISRTARVYKKVIMGRVKSGCARQVGKCCLQWSVVSQILGNTSYFTSARVPCNVDFTSESLLPVSCGNITFYSKLTLSLRVS